MLLNQIIRVFKDEESKKVDWMVVLFFLNAFLVVYGYSLRGALFQLIKFGRLGLVIISIITLFATKGGTKYVFSSHKNWVLWIFLLLNLYVLAFSVNFTKSVERILSWIPFMVYINYFITYLFRRYEKTEARMKLIRLFLLAYVFPLIIFFIYANPLVSRNIYGKSIGGYKSNVLGWSGLVFFILAIDWLINANPGGLLKKLLIGGIVFSVLALMSTGSRSSYLSMAISVMILVINSKRISLSVKGLISIFIAGVTFYTLNDPTSAINQRIEKSETQLKKGEVRFQMAQIAFEAMVENPTLLITGFGYDNFREGISVYKGVDLDLPSHNSYLELFITTGFFSFTFFLIFIVLNAIIKYILFDVRRFIFLPTFIIIPFFESNLNAGQFLFFPWMTFMFFYVHATSPQIPVRQFLESGQRRFPSFSGSGPMMIKPMK